VAIVKLARLAVWPALLGAAGVMFGCAQPAKAPALPTNADARTRGNFYESYRLRGDLGFFAATWKRSDGEYEWGQLAEVARQFPDSQDVYESANTRSFVLAGAGAVGGGIVGYTFGYNLAVPADQRMSSEAQVALYATGGGIILATLIVEFIWKNPAEDFADVYNRALRHQLGLSAPAAFREPGGSRRTGFLVAPLRDGSFGFRF
jgi:hypothetical protein